MKTKLFALLAFVALPLAAAVQPEIIIINSVPVDFAPFTVGNNVTTRINAVMGAEPHLNPGTDCAGVVQLRFYDARGGVLAEKTAHGAATVFVLAETIPPLPVEMTT